MKECTMSCHWMTFGSAHSSHAFSLRTDIWLRHEMSRTAYAWNSKYRKLSEEQTKIPGQGTCDILCPHHASRCIFVPGATAGLWVVDFRTQGGFATNHLQCRFELTPENCTTQHQISRGLTELRIRSHSAYIRILLLISAHSLSSAGLDMIAMNTSSKPFEHRNMQCLLASGATP